MQNNYLHLLRLTYFIIALLLLFTLKPIGHTDESRLYDFKPLPEWEQQQSSSEMGRFSPTQKTAKI